MTSIFQGQPPQNKALSNQNKGHLGSGYIYIYVCIYIYMCRYELIFTSLKQELQKLLIYSGGISLIMDASCTHFSSSKKVLKFRMFFDQKMWLHTVELGVDTCEPKDPLEEELLSMGINKARLKSEKCAEKPQNLFRLPTKNIFKTNVHSRKKKQGFIFLPSSIQKIETPVGGPGSRVG